MKIQLRLPRSLWLGIHSDLSRPHPFAGERVGFLTCGAASLRDTNLLLLGQQWYPVEDQEYVDDPGVGAHIGPSAFRRILQTVHRQPACVLHVHRHEHHGYPRFSGTDERSMREFVPGFFNACGFYPHGALVLSHDAAAGAIWTERANRQSVDQFQLVGTPLAQWSER